MKNRSLIIPKVFKNAVKQIIFILSVFFLVADMTTTSERVKNRLEQLDAFEVKIKYLLLYVVDESVVSLFRVDSKLKI